MKNLRLYFLVLTIISSVALFSFIWKADEVSQVAEKDLFSEFIKAFPKGDLPYEIKASAYTEAKSEDKKDDNKSYISSKYAQFVPGLMRSMYSRTPPPSFKYEHKLYENDEFVIVVYSIIPAFSSLLNLPNEYVLATYQKSKEDIAPHKRMISSITLSEKSIYLRLGKIDADLKVTVASYANGLDAEKQKLYSTKEYQIETSGSISKTNTTIHKEEQQQQKAKPKAKVDRAK